MYSLYDSLNEWLNDNLFVAIEQVSWSQKNQSSARCTAYMTAFSYKNN